MVKTTTSQSAVEAKPTVMKAVHAAHIVDKNSRTIAKILQLLVRAAFALLDVSSFSAELLVSNMLAIHDFSQDVTQRPSAAKVDPEGHTTRRVGMLVLNMIPFRFCVSQLSILKRLQTSLTSRN